MFMKQEFVDMTYVETNIWINLSTKKNLNGIAHKNLIHAQNMCKILYYTKIPTRRNN